MNHRPLTAAFAALVILTASLALAADGDKPANPAPANPAPAKPAARATVLGAWGTPGAQAPSVFVVIMNLGELNLKPDFTLTPDQKEKIQAIREEVSLQQEKWRNDHAEDFKAIQSQAAELRGVQNDPARWKAITDAQTALRDTMPKEDEAIDKIRGLLTTDQLKMLTAKEDENRARLQRAMKDAQRMQNGGGLVAPGSPAPK